MEMANKNGVVRVPNQPANGLQRFVITSKHICYRNPGDGDEREGGGGEEEEEEDAIELRLGLSSNGRFGTDPVSRKRKNNNELTRSSSIPEGFAAGETRIPVVAGVPDMLQVSRTRSLPVNTEEEDRRRKELQSRRRVEAKRRRSEKTTRAVRESHTHQREETRNTHIRNHGIVPGRSCENNGGERRSLDLNDHFAPAEDEADVRGKKGNVVTSGGCSNGGSSECDTHGERREETRERGVGGEDSSGRERARNILESMPRVTTREGKKVEGFLYWMGGKREDVRIVCVCHGTFLSPADFLRHGGASAADLLDPLRHIVVRPPPSL